MAWAMIRWSEVSGFIEHIEHNAGVKKVSHGLQVCKFCNHLVELYLLFGSKRSPSVLYHILLGILKPGKPAGSARVLICNCCHHKLIIFMRCKDTKKECLMKQEMVISFYIVYQAVMRKFTLAGKAIGCLRAYPLFTLMWFLLHVCHFVLGIELPGYVYRHAVLMTRP